RFCRPNHGLTLIFYLSTRRPPSSTLFPYTTLFRSIGIVVERRVAGGVVVADHGLPVDRLILLDHQIEERVDRVLPSLLGELGERDRKSTRLNSSHVKTSYAVFCLKKKISTTIIESW